ncbi:hypothetical protein COY18_00500 [Candidatus Saccharibacteria bacterium CG_4_10_14_0_2_um_filter_41_11]|nr:MAG: hypothetical protein COY18_00500 [Candidatus Saccharibacteria bacterium CG_4_10_14_0_2_um_filter_41_11]
MIKSGIKNIASFSIYLLSKKQYFATLDRQSGAKLLGCVFFLIDSLVKAKQQPAELAPLKQSSA